MFRPQRLVFALLLLLPAPLARAAGPLTLERIMADPDWIGPPVERPYWALDGRAVYYSAKRAGSPIHDRHRVELADGRDHVVEPAALADLDEPGAVFDRAHQRAAFVRNGDVFVRDLASGRLQQLTRTPEPEASPQFSADGRDVQFRSGFNWYRCTLASGLVSAVALPRAEKDPDDKHANELEKLQLRLIATLKAEHDDRDALRQHGEELRRADSTRAPRPIFLGDSVAIVSTHLSPSGTWLIAVTNPKSYEAGRIEKTPHYMTESGYPETEDDRTIVGHNDPPAQTVWLVELAAGTHAKLALGGLPGFHDDPLAAIRAENARALAERDTAAARKAREAAAKAMPNERSVRVDEVRFTGDGARVAIELRANDNKDRWIVTTDPAHPTLACEHRLTDPAWINWNFNDLGWLKDDHTLWYLSEESGFSQLYVKPPEAIARALTSGRFEVSAPRLAPDGTTFYVRANVEAPYAYDVYRVAVAGGALERVSQLRGVARFELSPDGTQLLVEHSSSHVPAQLALVPAVGGPGRELTDTRTSAYKAMPWREPEIVGVMSSHTHERIWSKFYDAAPGSGSALRPIVLFVHGAGYLQNTQLQFPYYFREQMFNELLTERGFLVLDMDYRASEGYGRGWRTAIYRQMGTPELKDLEDGVQWLVREHHGDPRRVGVYGGSYGGFLTLMAMFRAPDVFRAGAALRPVSDWTQYNHEYTADILNTPQVDDIAYRRSSPIEFAEGLRGPLLICHGMIDDNVFFDDTVRLYQRLIELHKDDIELAPYPLERHGFEHADSWLDEFKRIDRLFETRLKP